MTTKDIRWQQRFSNFSKALAQLGRFIDKGVTDIKGSCDAFRMVFNRGLIDNCKSRMTMIESRSTISFFFCELVIQLSILRKFVTIS